jgi:hypothetical protein
MKKSRKREFAKEKHGETCMCKRCRAKIEAIFYRKGQPKINGRDYKDLSRESYDD